MCDHYAKLDDRIIVIHKVKGGASSARNAGLDHANGNYIGFVDSDDYIGKDMYNQLYHDLEESHADVACCGFYHHYEGQTLKNYNNSSITILNRRQAFSAVFLDRDFTTAVWNKIYKKNIFQKLRFPEGKIAEDTFIILDIIRQCDYLAINTKQAYYYCHRNGSVSYSMNDRTFDMIDACRRNLEIVNKDYPELSFYAEARVYWAYFNVLDRILIKDKESTYKKQYQMLLTELKRNIFRILRMPLSKGRKAMALVLKVNAKLYKLIIKKMYMKYKDFA
jgi:glycosyltransferase involved in cell wall biosynthesis